MRQAALCGVALALLLAACGQKGALYLPDKNAAVVTSAPAALPPPPPPEVTPPPPVTPTPKKPGDKDQQAQPPK